jgi:putative membrane protein
VNTLLYIHHHTDINAHSGQFLLTIPFFLASAVFGAAVVLSNRKFKQHSPHTRTLLFFAGVICASIALSGPVAEQAAVDFSYHMAGHLLLGMLAPLLIALSVPMTLIMRALPVRHARKLSHLLKSRAVTAISDPLFSEWRNN